MNLLFEIQIHMVQTTDHDEDGDASELAKEVPVGVYMQRAA